MSALAAAWAALVIVVAWYRRPLPGRLTALAKRCSPDHRDEPLDHRRRRWRARAGIAGLIVAAIALGAVWPPLIVVLPVAAVARRRWAAARQRRRAGDAVKAALPDVVDLLAVAIGAGLTPTLAIRHLATLTPEPFAAAFAEVDRRVARGQRVADALGALIEALGEPIRPVVAAITGTERYGAPLSPTLDLLGHEARRERRRQAEERARTLPVKLCFPLVGCILPAFVLLTIAPLIAGALHSLAYEEPALPFQTPPSGGAPCAPT
jgi:tight adherence protein C